VFAVLATLACGGSTETDEVSSAARCAGLDEQFDELYRLSLTCPKEGASCKLQFDRSIDGCGYYVLGDYSHQDAVDAMRGIQREWMDLDCNPSATCAVGGFLPIWPAKCSPSSTSPIERQCVDDKSE
jgi:hypothetical protein